MSAVRVLAHAGAVRGGVRHFLHHATIDMDTLARELAVSRATLYRIVRSRDALLGDVLCALGDSLVEDVRADRHPRGVEGVIDVSRRFAHQLRTAEPLWRFAVHEPDVAHRVLLSPTGRVHARAVTVQRELFLQIGGPAIGSADEVRVPRPVTGPVPATGRSAGRGPTSLVVPSPRPPDARPDVLTDRAFLYIRILESVLYGPMLAGRRPDFTLAEPALRAVLT